MDIRRRALLTLPGESLLVSTSPVEAAIRAEQLASLTGIPPRSLLNNALCAVPLPLYPVEFGPRRRWPKVRADAMWCPLLWLPPRLSQRLPVRDGPAGVESDELWAVRVALELSATGVYDDASGTWVDILSLMGLDTDSASDIARIRRWLDGGRDETLDSFDLAEHMYAADDLSASRSLDVAEKSLAILRASAWTYAADDLLETCHELIVANRDGSRRNPARLAVGTILHLGMLAFAEVDGETAWWSAARQHMSDTGDAVDLIEEMLPTVAEHLAALRNSYAPMARMFSMSMRSINAPAT